ncbi:unnamed protein product [Discosporangium mesarthrocarpum]
MCSPASVTWRGHGWMRRERERERMSYCRRRRRPQGAEEKRRSPCGQVHRFHGSRAPFVDPFLRGRFHDQAEGGSESTFKLKRGRDGRWQRLITTTKGREHTGQDRPQDRPRGAQRSCVVMSTANAFAGVGRKAAAGWGSELSCVEPFAGGTQEELHIVYWVGPSTLVQWCPLTLTHFFHHGLDARMYIPDPRHLGHRNGGDRTVDGAMQPFEMGEGEGLEDGRLTFSRSLRGYQRHAVVLPCSLSRDRVRVR